MTRKDRLATDETRELGVTRKERRQGLIVLARSYAAEFSYSDRAQAIPDLQELRELIQGQRNKSRILTLLSEVTSTGRVPVERIRLQDVPRLLPFPAPFHLAENANYFITQLAMKYIKQERRAQLDAYIEENEDEILIAMLHHGDEAMFFDLPDYVTQGQVRKRMKTRLLQVIEGRHPRIRVDVAA